MAKQLWQPTLSQIEHTQVWQFMQTVNHKYSLNLQEYSQLHEWSVENSEQFWSDIWDSAGVVGDKGREPYLVDGQKMPGARWFPGARLNFAENLLKFRDNRTAILFRNEQGGRQSLSYSDLYASVAQCASALRHLGVGKGDVVAGFLPNLPQTCVAMLAATSLGATWTSCSPDFGFQGVLDRFGQVAPKVLFTVSAYLYNGKRIETLEKSAQLVDALPSVEQLVVIPYIDEYVELSGISKALHWEDFVDTTASEIRFESMAFDDPLYIMYSSGTTGQPKCIVHGIGGTLLQHLKEHQLHTDLRREDTLFYYTTCGWMMWNWLVSGLATGATLMLFDGSPFAPGPRVLWDMAEQESVTIFGTSAKYLAALEKAGFKPRESHNLSQLRTILSTGSPLSNESFEYVYRDIKEDLLLASISGGTDIISCFALGCPILPVYAGELQCRGLGMAVAILDDGGETVVEQKGELVCCAPFPSMPIGFWDDPRQVKYRSAYFDRFENIWAHGDYGEITKQGGLIIHGRSDAVLNPGGVRIGTAEIYRQVEQLGEVLESVCIGQPYRDDTRVVLFVVLREDFRLDDELKMKIRQQILRNTTPRHVPAVIIQVSEIPRTISGKIVELAVRKTVLGEKVNNVEALANPHALELFKNLAELQE
ncbi:acetoacetate--CoA ligase [Marinobacterium sp. xm-d-564]|uniref:acetoacetate--CoA ligase n=1 Tax=Marinobacterium sp. xm-d-564 TaxID=2497742 RepID=UPI001568D037|nr:acetoacetate--CoA ligase [Marinobacterium sp. xm-d-564]NRP59414.1 Acetyl-coenzyme A synthetase [Marinobacterium sp. xm-d-564]